VQVSDCAAIGSQHEELPDAGRRVGEAEPVRRHGIYSRGGSWRQNRHPLL